MRRTGIMLRGCSRRCDSTARSRSRPTRFELLNNLQLAPVGVYTGITQVRLANMIDAVLGSIGASWGANRFDKIKVGRLDLPGKDPVARIGTADIIHFELLDTPQQINPPLRKARAAWQRELDARPLADHRRRDVRPADLPGE